MVRKKDEFWEFAEELHGRFKCKFCKKDFSGGITRVKSHLSGITGRDIAVCVSVPEEIQARAVLAIGGGSKRSRSELSANISGGSVVGSSSTTPFPKGSQQQTVPKMVAKKDKAYVDQKMANMFVMNNIAFNVVQSKSFIECIKAVADYGTDYVVPSYSTLRAKLIPDEKKRVEMYVKNVKKSWEKTGCTIMSDIRTDLEDRTFINVISYSPGGAIFLKSVECSKEKKTGLYLHDVISSTIEDIGPGNVVQLIVNNVANYEAAGNMLMERYPHVYKTTCVAHGIHLLLKDIGTKVEWINNIFNECKMIVDYMYRHTIVLSLMRQFTKNKELKSPRKTRFASQFFMLQSILDVENGLRLLVASQEWRGMNYSKSQMAEKVVDIIQRASFWKDALEVVQALRPLVRVLRLVDGYGSTSGYLYDAMQRARECLKQCCDNNSNKYQAVLASFDSWQRQNILYKIHAVASLLNPAYMCSPNFKEDGDMRSGLDYVLEKLVPHEDKVEFVRNMTAYRVKSPKLFTAYAKILMETAHPCIWWEQIGGVYPTLQKIAIRLLSQPCSLSVCERNWSALEAAQTKKRNRLSPDMLEDLVYVRMNAMMMEKVGDMQTKDAEAINLDNLDPLPEQFNKEREEDDNEDVDEPRLDSGLDLGGKSSNCFDSQTLCN